MQAPGYRPGHFDSFMKLLTAACRCAFSFLAASFRPMARIALALGPMKVSPAASTASTKSGFSERKPKPGWIASAPVAWAAAMMTSPLR